MCSIPLKFYFHDELWLRAIIFRHAIFLPASCVAGDETRCWSTSSQFFFHWTPSVPTKKMKARLFDLLCKRENVFFSGGKVQMLTGKFIREIPDQILGSIDIHTSVGREMPMQRVSNTHPFPLSVWQEDHTEEKRRREKKRGGWKVQGIQNEPLLFPTHPAPREEKENGMGLKESSEEGKRSGGVTSFSWPEFFPLLPAGKGGRGEI